MLCPNHMQYKNLRPMLWTRQFQETLTFYTQVLGFSCGERNDEWGWASIHRDGVDLMIAYPPEQTPFEHPHFTGSFYIQTDEVDALWTKLKNKVKIVYDIGTFEWDMREFGIYDNNGYIIQFGQDIKTLGKNQESVS